LVATCAADADSLLVEDPLPLTGRWQSQSYGALVFGIKDETLEDDPIGKQNALALTRFNRSLG
jgi:hypothetical protein